MFPFILIQQTAEVNHVVGDTTARELAKLSAHLAQNPHIIDSKFGHNHHKHALLRRFAEGDYAGIPYRGVSGNGDDGDTRMDRRRGAGGLLQQNGRKFGNTGSGGSSGTMWRMLRRVLTILAVCVVIVALVLGNLLFLSDLE